MPPPRSAADRSCTACAAVSETPASAHKIATLAGEHGWLVTITYVRGPWMPGTRFEREVDSVVVRMRRGTERVLAFWHDGKFSSGVTDELNIGSLLLKAVKARIAQPPREDAA